MKKVIWIDTETTGLNPKVNGLIEIGFIIEIDKVEIEKIRFKMNPLTYIKKRVEISEEALKINGVNPDDFKTYNNSDRAFEIFIQLIGRHIDKEDKKDKFTIKGYNVDFDIDFLKEWFLDNDNQFFSSWFTHKPIDVFALVKILKDQELFKSENDKLLTVCTAFDIELEAHHAMNDIIATKELYEVLTNKFLKGI